jgi:hypothetical protein
VTDHHVYQPLGAPDVEVKVDGEWWPGEARMRTTHRDGRVVYQVQFRREGQTYLNRFPGDRVRLDARERGLVDDASVRPTT